MKRIFTHFSRSLLILSLCLLSVLCAGILSPCSVQAFGSLSENGTAAFMGIGIAPQKILHVSGSGPGSVPLFSRGSDSAGFIIERSSTNRWVLGVNENPALGNGFVLSTIPINTTSVPRLLVTQDGRVGIGTISPDSGAKMHVVTSATDVGSTAILGQETAGSDTAGIIGRYGTLGSGTRGLLGATAVGVYGVNETANNHGFLGGSSYGVKGESHSTGGDGVLGTSVSGYGGRFNSTGNQGVRIDNAGSCGVYVESAGSDGIAVNNADGNGFSISHADFRGVDIGTAGTDGLHVASAGTDGVHIHNAIDDGVEVDNATQWGGKFVGHFGGVLAATYGDDIIQGWDSTGTYGGGSYTFRVGRDGYVVGKEFHSTGGDYAEMLPAAGGLESGDVLVIGTDGKLALSRQPYATAVAGVYSTKPGFMGGSGIGDDPTGKVPLAVVGVVPVKASAENGSINPGDLLSTSGTPGHSMKATEPRLGSVIGKALEGLGSGTGTIKALVTLQ